MARRLLIFNPENDLALAHGTAFFTPPVSAITLARDLHLLPNIWAIEDDVVYDLYGVDTLPNNIKEVVPWGWSHLLVRQLLQRGVESSLLPSEKMIDDYRSNSSRHKAVKALNTICHDFLCGEKIIGEAFWCESMRDVLQAHQYCKNSLMKAPWSGSGRGLHRIHPGKIDEKSEAWAKHILEKQGGVVVEKFYEQKVLDFAMEFMVEKGQVHYLGLSVFETKAGGVYAGNIVSSEEYKTQLLTNYVSEELLLNVKNTVEKLLNEHLITRWYCGPVGVDMMICKIDDGDYAIHPFVEMNQRMTMGWVALELSKKQPQNEVKFFSIQCEKGRYAWHLIKNL